MLYNKIIPHHLKKLFYNWLIKKSLLSAYLQNMDSIGNRVSESRHVYHDELINHSFYWANSPQGHKFWSDVNWEWKRFISRYMRSHPMYREKWVNR